VQRSFEENADDSKKFCEELCVADVDGKCDDELQIVSLFPS
jgi:hypothetical protein